MAWRKLFEEAEQRCIDGQVHLAEVKRVNVEAARRALQRAEFEASAIAYGLDNPESAKVRGRNAEIRKIELGRFLSQNRGVIAAQRVANTVAKDITMAEADLARLEARLHGKQNQLRADVALAQLLGGRDD